MSIWDALEDAGQWIAGAAQDTWTGVDDGVSGWEELFTGNRKEKLQRAQMRINAIVLDVQDAQTLYSEASTTHAQIVEALGRQAAAMKQTIQYAPGATMGDLGRISAGLSGVALGGAALLELTGMVSTTVAAFSAVAAPVMAVAAIAVATIQTIFQGIEVAQMRNEIKRLDTATQGLNGMLPNLLTEFTKLVGLLRQTYEPLTPTEEGRHFVKDPGGTKYYLGEYFSNLLKIINIIQHQDDGDRREMQKMVATVSHECSVIRKALLDSIQNSMAEIFAMVLKVPSIADAIQDGMTDERITFYLNVDAPLVAAVHRFLSEYPGHSAKQVRLLAQPGKHVSIIPQ